MSVATIKLVDSNALCNFYFTSDPTLLARKLLTSDGYIVQGKIDVPDLKGKDVAEEIFDLTNNPSRQSEREELYGRFRSVSVGDIVNVDGADWLCCSQGWWKL